MADKLSWDNVPMGEETVTDDDVKKAETMGGTPPGKYLCTCVESNPREVKTKEYTAIAANLKFQIDEVLEIEGKKVEGNDGAPYENKFLWDDVFMERDGEKDGMRSRRILIASRMGLVKPGEKMGHKTWSQEVLQKQVILTTVENIYKDKETGQEKVGRPKVDFAGYESIDGAQKTASDSFDDL